MNFYEKIIRAERRAQIKDKSKFDILAMIDTLQQPSGEDTFKILQIYTGAQ